MLRTIGCTLLTVAAAACMSPEDEANGDGSSTADPSGSMEATVSASSPCDTVTASAGWRSDFVPQQYTSTAKFGFFATPNEPSGRPIDAVIGLANGPASHFADLGPIIRFNP